MTEVWLRNPHAYIRELALSGQNKIAWDRGQLVRSRIDPIKISDLYFGATSGWRSLAIGVQGAAEYRTGDTEYEPTAVYPVWQYGEDIAILEELIEYPPGRDADQCSDMTLPGDERPVFGQEDRIIVVGIPPVNSGPGRAFISELKDIQDQYPKTIIHLHALYSYRVMFGLGFGAADTDPRITASKGTVTLPNGKEVSLEVATAHHVAEVRRLGFKPVDLKDPKKRCVFNILSAVDASLHWADAYARQRIASRTERPVDTTTPDASFKVPAVRRPVPVGLPGDKIMCDSCSLSDNCDYARDGSVCGLPRNETSALAAQFKTRDSDRVIDGLSSLLTIGADRLERAVAIEEKIGDVDPNVTKMLDQVFDHGVKYAKLIDPSLARPAVQVNIGPGAGRSPAPNPKALAASFIRELEAQGIKREDITPEMVQAMAIKQIGATNVAQAQPEEVTLEVVEPQVVEAEVIETEDGS